MIHVWVTDSSSPEAIDFWWPPDKDALKAAREAAREFYGAKIKNRIICFEHQGEVFGFRGTLTDVGVRDEMRVELVFR